MEEGYNVTKLGEKARRLSKKWFAHEYYVLTKSYEIASRLQVGLFVLFGGGCDVHIVNTEYADVSYCR